MRLVCVESARIKQDSDKRPGSCKDFQRQKKKGVEDQLLEKVNVFTNTKSAGT